MAGVDGRVALVTGASQGIGRACALVLAQAGAKVALCARNQEKLDQLANEINGSGGEAAAFKLDVGSEDEIKAVVKAVVAKFGKLRHSGQQCRNHARPVGHAHEAGRLG